MKNHFFLGKLKTINILKAKILFNPAAIAKNVELFSQLNGNKAGAASPMPDIKPLLLFVKEIIYRFHN